MRLTKKWIFGGLSAAALVLIIINRGVFVRFIQSADIHTLTGVSIVFAAASIVIALGNVILRDKSSFSTIEISVSLLIALTFIILAFVMERSAAYHTVAASTVQIEIADMQANTLSITALIVTFASLILTILSVYREKKTDENIKVIDETANRVEDARETIKTLANMASLQLISPENHEFYYDVLDQYIDDATKKDSEYNEYLWVAKIAIEARKVGRDNQDVSNPAIYDQIIKLANRVIESDTSQLNKQFAYFEALNCLYLKIHYSIQINPVGAEDDIKHALSLLGRFSNITEDRSGNISNLYGLIYLWSGIAEKRIHEIANRQGKKSQHFRKAVEYVKC